MKKVRYNYRSYQDYPNCNLINRVTRTKVAIVSFMSIVGGYGCNVKIDEDHQAFTICYYDFAKLSRHVSPLNSA